MALATIATVLTVATTAASLANMGYQAAQGAPGMPNLAAASRETAEAQANALPTQRAIAAAEQQGRSVDYQSAAHKEKTQTAFVPSEGASVTVNGKTFTMPGRGGSWVPYDPKEWEPGGKYNPNGTQAVQPRLKNQNINIPAQTKTADFTGYGTADIEGQLARQQADIESELGKKYGVQFADQARQMQELADPLGTQARAKEYEMIKDSLDHPKPINPLSAGLERDIDAQLKAGSGLDSMSREMLDKAVADASKSRGGGGPSSGSIAADMGQGYEGEARRQAGIDKAQGFVGSGQTPEDIQYKRDQQDISNLGAFTSGQTPQSQFGAIAGAGQGSTPVVNGQKLPGLPANAGASGAGYAASAAGAQAQQQSNQASPYFAGLSALLSGINAFSNSVR